ncbi:MAG TPA: type II 3-dehydroquinate dehydratase [Actinomycetota bacterium]|nr:type II 3-dehydroquinate dehydratase [Actinomycetota bacterium]
MKVLLLLGPNLGALAGRESELYGGEPLEDVMASVARRAADLDHELTWRQSDAEADHVRWLLAAPDEGFDAVIANPGALTHYSHALGDALEASGLPAVEVHQTNVFAREGFRRRSVISEACRAVIVGLGVGGYHVALEALGWITETEGGGSPPGSTT